MITVYLPDNSLLINKDYICNLEIGKNLYICFNKLNYTNGKFGKGQCYNCLKCKQSIIAEKTEDNKEVWVEFDESKS